MNLYLKLTGKYFKSEYITALDQPTLVWFQNIANFK